jgi:hypothetical protein
MISRFVGNLARTYCDTEGRERTVRAIVANTLITAISSYLPRVCAVALSTFILATGCSAHTEYTLGDTEYVKYRGLGASPYHSVLARIDGRIDGVDYQYRRALPVVPPDPGICRGIIREASRRDCERREEARHEAVLKLVEKKNRQLRILEDGRRWLVEYAEHARPLFDTHGLDPASVETFIRVSDNLATFGSGGEWTERLTLEAYVMIPFEGKDCYRILDGKLRRAEDDGKYVCFSQTDGAPSVDRTIPPTITKFDILGWPSLFHQEPMRPLGQ